jgi:hypothetical protein
VTVDLARARRIVLPTLVTLVTAVVADAQDPADRVPIHIGVEHLHNTGSCKGELIVDKWLFSFRSTDRPNDDRDWKLKELKAAESKKPDELVLRTRDAVRGLGLDKNYKFRVPGGLDRKVLDYMNERID